MACLGELFVDDGKKELRCLVIRIYFRRFRWRQLTAGVLHGRFEKFLRPTQQPDAVLACLFAVCGVAAVLTGDLWIPGHCGRWRWLVGAYAVAFERKWRVAEWVVARRKRIWFASRRTCHAHNAVLV